MTDFRSGFILGIFCSGGAVLVVLALLYAVTETLAWLRGER